MAWSFAGNLQGPAGPSAVSADAGNSARLGSDGKVYVGASSYTLPIAQASSLGGLKVGTPVAGKYASGVAADGTIQWSTASATGSPLRLPPTDMGSGFNGIDAYWYQDTANVVRLQLPSGHNGILIAGDGQQTFSKIPLCGTAPTADNHLANKAYVDSKTAAGTYLPLAGGTMTGGITLPTTIASFSYGSTGYNWFGGSSGVALRSNTTNLWTTTSANTTFNQTIVAQPTGGVQMGSGGSFLKRGSSSTKIAATGMIELPTDAPAASEAIRKDYADSTYATKVVMSDVFDELAALKSEVAALKAAA
ncbi:hypothetical protein KBY57_12115 [Cyanobium sp. Aljojuca 7D2]|uniref:hypothetical protein n=1 Tax=Cyanobium sp. Aljojuca 7D2 TaxID=2823698 RepID=UPI0020CF1998|nr:hypothetical protein [Cyanobium sp. Aljojuca 7D2]MCP9891790.1 hypothetical protein [Cyanobium sp. Aljojuca 7D2]